VSRPMAGRQLGRYEILTQLASGGMASVYIARSQGVAGFERLVAIKVLHPHLAYEQEFISMFLDEARLAARTGREAASAVRVPGARRHATRPWRCAPSDRRAW
jgi:hypothetical protein